MKNMKSILAIAMALILSLALFAGCGAATTPGTNLATGGTLCLRVNPEIAIHYDADGNVTGVESRNADAAAILETYTGYEGKATRDVVAELVTAIGEAGYFVEEIEGERRQITIEIEPGSSLPSDTFLTDVADQVRTTVSANDWTNPVNLQGTTDYGLTDYVDTDYGPDADGYTDYDDTDYGPNNDGVTDYTDYGTTPTAPAVSATQPTTGSAGHTDYDDTDYGPNNDGITDYDDTNYGPNNDGVTDYDDTDYGPNNDGVTDYDGTDYDNDDCHTDYHANCNH